MNDRVNQHLGQAGDQSPGIEEDPWRDNTAADEFGAAAPGLREGIDPELASEFDDPHRDPDHVQDVVAQEVKPHKKSPVVLGVLLSIGLTAVSAFGYIGYNFYARITGRGSSEQVATSSDSPGLIDTAATSEKGASSGGGGLPAPGSAGGGVTLPMGAESGATAAPQQPEPAPAAVPAVAAAAVAPAAPVPAVAPAAATAPAPAAPAVTPAAPAVAAASAPAPAAQVSATKPVPAAPVAAPVVVAAAPAQPVRPEFNAEPAKPAKPDAKALAAERAERAEQAKQAKQAKQDAKAQAAEQKAARKAVREARRQAEREAAAATAAATAAAKAAAKSAEASKPIEPKPVKVAKAAPHAAPKPSGKPSSKSAGKLAGARVPGVADKPTANSERKSFETEDRMAAISADTLSSYHVMSIWPRSGEHQQAWVRDPKGHMHIVRTGDSLEGMKVVSIDYGMFIVKTSVGQIR